MPPGQPAIQSLHALSARISAITTSPNLFANPRKLTIALAVLYTFVGLTSLLNHHPYEAGFWWCIGGTQVLGTLSKQRAPATRRWLTAASVVTLVAGLSLLGLHVRFDW